MWPQYAHNLVPYSSSQSQSSYIIRNPQQRRISQSQPVRGRDEEQDDIVSADVEEVVLIVLIVVDERLLFGGKGKVVTSLLIANKLLLGVIAYMYMLPPFRLLLYVLICGYTS